MVLLPLLATIITDPKVIATGDAIDVEQAMATAVMAKVDAGWVVADLHNEQTDYVIVLAKGDRVERHVVHYDATDDYRVYEDADMPANPEEPTSFVAEAFASPRGSFAIAESCGERYITAYLVDDAATGEFASTLVTRTLATATDVLGVSDTGHRIEVALVRGDRRLDLVVSTDDKDRITEAEVRRHEYGNDNETRYLRLDAMHGFLRRARVTAIHRDHGVTSLVTTRGKFVLVDPTGDTWRSSDEEYEGCGC